MEEQATDPSAPRSSDVNFWASPSAALGLESRKASPTRTWFTLGHWESTACLNRTEKVMRGTSQNCRRQSTRLQELPVLFFLRRIG